MCCLWFEDAETKRRLQCPSAQPTRGGARRESRSGAENGGLNGAGSLAQVGEAPGVAQAMQKHKGRAASRERDELDLVPRRSERTEQTA